MENQNKLAENIRTHQQSILKEWVDLQLAAPTLRLDLMKESELRDQSGELLSLFTQALQGGSDIANPAWKTTKDFLAQVAKSRALQGFNPSETAIFIYSLKQPLFGVVRTANKDEKNLFADLWTLTQLIDGLGLYTIEIHQKNREEYHSPSAAGIAGIVDTRRPIVRKHPRVAVDWNPRQCADPDRHGESFGAHRGNGRYDRDHRYHGSTDRRHSGRAAPSQNGRSSTPHGR